MKILANPSRSISLSRFFAASAKLRRGLTEIASRNRSCATAFFTVFFSLFLRFQLRFRPGFVNTLLFDKGRDTVRKTVCYFEKLRCIRLSGENVPYQSQDQLVVRYVVECRTRTDKRTRQTPLCKGIQYYP